MRITFFILCWIPLYFCKWVTIFSALVHSTEKMYCPVQAKWESQQWLKASSEIRFRHCPVLSALRKSCQSKKRCWGQFRVWFQEVLTKNQNEDPNVDASRHTLYSCYIWFFFKRNTRDLYQHAQNHYMDNTNTWLKLDILLSIQYLKKNGKLLVTLWNKHHHAVVVSLID